MIERVGLNMKNLLYATSRIPGQLSCNACRFGSGSRWKIYTKGKYPAMIERVGLKMENLLYTGTRGRGVLQFATSPFWKFPRASSPFRLAEYHV